MAAVVAALRQVELFEQLVRLLLGVGVGRALEAREEREVLARRQQLEQHVVLRADAVDSGKSTGSVRMPRPA